VIAPRSTHIDRYEIRARQVQQHFHAREKNGDPGERHCRPQRSHRELDYMKVLGALRGSFLGLQKGIAGATRLWRRAESGSGDLTGQRVKSHRLYLWVCV